VATCAPARRRGYASSLVRELLDRIDRAATAADDGVSIGLYGSTSGTSLYASLGFRDVGWAQLVRGCGQQGSKCSGPPFEEKRRAEQLSVRLVPARDALQLICSLDREIYGADRAADIARWARSEKGEERGTCWALSGGAGAVVVEGYVLCRPMHPTGV